MRLNILGSKGSILVWTNHINYEKCIEYGFLAPWVYLCSTSFKVVMVSIYTKNLQNYFLRLGTRQIVNFSLDAAQIKKMFCSIYNNGITV